MVGRMEIDWEFIIFKLDIFLRFGGMFIEDGLDTTRFDWIFGGKNEESSCGDLERDISFVGIS